MMFIRNMGIKCRLNEGCKPIGWLNKKAVYGELQRDESK